MGLVSETDAYSQGINLEDGDIFSQVTANLARYTIRNTICNDGKIFAIER